jgi:hypothetical protein
VSAKRIIQPIDPLKEAISRFMAQKPKVIKTRDGKRTCITKKVECHVKTPKGRGHLMISSIEIQES